MSNKDIETKEKKEKKQNKVNEWWSDHWGAVLTVGAVAGLIYAGKKALGKAADEHATKMLQLYGEASDLNLLEESGTYNEKVEKAIAKIREEKGLDELTDTIKEKVGELSELCKDKGVEVSLGTMLGNVDGCCEIETYLGSLNVD